jgi:hypothetical protein
MTDKIYVGMLGEWFLTEFIKEVDSYDLKQIRELINKELRVRESTKKLKNDN